MADDQERITSAHPGGGSAYLVDRDALAEAAQDPDLPHALRRSIRRFLGDLGYWPEDRP